ncbi:SEC-C metal-binding domain-containing protein [Actinopolymorpha alba]|uniref:SEC-C metal-binding domain-containing protein n=1 Tax=Actinopolymorpha alba TaxID=533267 RepID=UPI0003684E72|nr:SEC-C metal-binding domain-containing protein [Actinopolymorpha alba]
MATHEPHPLRSHFSVSFAEAHLDAMKPDLLRLLTQQGPLDLVDLAAAVGEEDEDAVEGVLLDMAVAYESREGWVSLLTVADGAVFTHVLTEDELATSALDGEDDLALWIRVAADDIPLRGGGLLGVTCSCGHLADESPVVDHRHTLVGPDGWLTSFRPGDVLALRLRDGAIDVSVVPDPIAAFEASKESLEEVRHAFSQAAMDALRDFAVRADDDDEGDKPGAPISAVVADLLLQRPAVFAEPLPPLGGILRDGHLELSGDLVGVAGTPWDGEDVDGLEPQDIVALTLARGGLRILDESSDLSELIKNLTASDEVLARIADEVEGEPVKAGLLAALRRTATGPLPQAAVLLLEARSAQAEGRVDQAAELIDSALELRPDLVPALCDAGEYAATRGHAVRADQLFEQGGLDSDHQLRRSLRPLTVLPTTRVSRNQPCPCGSGQKYKKCCLRNEVHPLPARAPLLFCLLLAYARRGRHVEKVTELVAASSPKVFSTCVDLAIFEAGIVDDYLTERGHWLREDERALLNRWRQVPLRLFEVVATRPGGDVTLRQLPDGPSIVVRDRDLYECAKRQELVLARVLDDGDRPALFCHPWHGDSDRRDDLLSALAQHAATPDPRAIAACFAPGLARDPRNDDGHELAMTLASYQLGDADHVWGQLAASLVERGPERLVAIGEDEKVRGVIQRRGELVQLTANSVERMDALQHLLLAADPAATLTYESSVLFKALGEGSEEERAEARAEYVRQVEEWWGPHWTDDEDD